jgi:hypothetical protein
MLAVLLAALSTGWTATSLAEDQLFEQNTDRPGLDYANFDLEPKGEGQLWGSEADCQLACQKDDKCPVWTVVKAGVQGPKARCWLKNAIPEPKANGCCTSGVIRRDVEPNTDRPGNDFANFDLRNANAFECQAACRNDQRCLAWTYVRPGVQGASPRCWLKDAVPAARASDCCTSGVGSTAQIVR